MSITIEDINRYSTCNFYFMSEDPNDFVERLDGLISYVFAKNGIFLAVNTPSFIAFVPTEITYKYFNDDLIELPSNYISIKFPRISINILKQIYDIFRKYSHEVYCVLYYDRTKERFIIHVPEQICSHASVRYDLSNSKYENSPEKYLKCIDFHSHPQGLKSHSYIDLNDSMKTNCISCVIDLGSTFLESTFEFKAPVPIKHELIDIIDTQIVDFGSKAIAVIDYSPERINVGESANNKSSCFHNNLEETDDIRKFCQLEKQLWRTI